jgi:hypothetical protein
MVEAFPLAWPSGYPRTPDYKRGRNYHFKAFSFAQARDSLMEEIRRLGAQRPVLSTNVSLRRDGLPYANQGIMKDPGVAVYFTRKGKSLVIACDRWDKIEANLRSIELTIDAMRGMERWGCSDMLDRAFTGFTALPSPQEEEWWRVFGFTSKPMRDRAEEAYRDQMKRAHPDVGGSTQRAQELNRAIEECRAGK